MDRQKEAELFEYLCRHRPFRAWIEDQMADQFKILTVNNDIEQIRRAQGRAQFLQGMLDRLTAAESAVRR